MHIELFYNGLNTPTRISVNSATGGTIFAPDEAYDMLEQITVNNFQWPSERSVLKKPVGVYGVDPITSLTAQVSALTSQIAAMKIRTQSNSEAAAVSTERGQAWSKPNMSTTEDMETIKVTLYPMSITLACAITKISPVPTTKTCGILLRGSTIKKVKANHHSKISLVHL